MAKKVTFLHTKLVVEAESAKAKLEAAIEREQDLTKEERDVMELEQNLLDQILLPVDRRVES